MSTFGKSMETYEYPLGVYWRASTPEHAAARVFGGKPADYLAIKRVGAPLIIDGKSVRNAWLEVSSEKAENWGEYLGEIPLA